MIALVTNAPIKLCFSYLNLKLVDKMAPQSSMNRFGYSHKILRLSKEHCVFAI